MSSAAAAVRAAQLGSGASSLQHEQHREAAAPLHGRLARRPLQDLVNDVRVAHVAQTVDQVPASPHGPHAQHEYCQPADEERQRERLGALGRDEGRRDRERGESKILPLLGAQFPKAHRRVFDRSRVHERTVSDRRAAVISSRAHSCAAFPQADGALASVHA